MSVSEKYESVKIMSQWKLWINEYYEREGEKYESWWKRCTSKWFYLMPSVLIQPYQILFYDDEACIVLNRYTEMSPSHPHFHGSIITTI